MSAKFEHVRRILGNAKFDEFCHGSNHPRMCLPLRKLKLIPVIGPPPGHWPAARPFGSTNLTFHGIDFFCRLVCIRSQRAQIEKTFETIPAKFSKTMPVLDDEYWCLLDEHLALLDLFFNASSTLMAVLFLKKALSLSSKLTLSDSNERLRSGDRPDSTSCILWCREHHELHQLTQSAKAMLLKTLMQRYDLQNESRWSNESRDLMICSLALDPRFKKFAVKLCGLSRGEEYVWGVVKDAANRHKRFERVSAPVSTAEDEVVQQSPKRARSETKKNLVHPLS